jgi:hypothetical protein
MLTFREYVEQSSAINMATCLSIGGSIVTYRDVWLLGFISFEQNFY